MTTKCSKLCGVCRVSRMINSKKWITMQEQHKAFLWAFLLACYRAGRAKGEFPDAKWGMLVDLVDYTATLTSRQRPFKVK
jgi:hypothetical protein